jgi:hypothetical protein
VVRVRRRVFQNLLDQTPSPERCLEAYHLYRTRFELIAERKVRRRQLTEDGNIEITGRDFRDRQHQSPRTAVCRTSTRLLGFAPSCGSVGERNHR